MGTPAWGVLTVWAPGKILALGDHAVQYGEEALAVPIDAYIEVVCEPAAGEGAPLEGLLHGTFQGVAEDLVEGGHLPACALPTQFGGRLLCELRARSTLPPAVGLGYSSAATVAAVATFLGAHRGAGALRPRQVAELASQFERRRCGASGCDAAASVLGPIRYSKPRGPSPSAYAPAELSIIFTGTPHRSAGRVAMTPEQLESARALVPATTCGAEAAITARLPAAHRLLAELGLESEEARRVVGIVPRAKITGKGLGGVLVCVPPLSAGEAEGLAAAGFEWRTVRPVGGLLLADSRLEGVPRGLSAVPLRTLRPGDSASATAPSNVALVKYWGKLARQFPLGPSASLPLPHCRATVALRTVPAFLPEDAPPPDRVARLIAEAAGEALPPGLRVEAQVVSNVPEAAGAASSAAVFAALARALAELLAVPPESAPGWVQGWARLGSGSAIRSTVEAGGVTVWEGTGARAHPLHDCLAEIEHLFVAFSPTPKLLASSAGHALAPTSPFLSARAAAADGNLRELLRAAKVGDFGALARVSEAEAAALHLVMATSDPPVRYLSGAALNFVAGFVAYRERFRLPAFWTADAGDSVHLLFLPSAAEGVRAFARQAVCAYTLDRGNVARYYRVIAIAGKRYAGKSHLAAQWAEELGGRAQVRELGAAVKAAYLRELALAAPGAPLPDLEQRGPKEQHRAQLTAFAERCLAADPHCWLREVWASLAPEPRVVLLVGLRRPPDLETARGALGALTVRVECSEATRASRGWRRSAVDAGAGETGLDAAEFDVRLSAESAFPALGAVERGRLAGGAALAGGATLAGGAALAGAVSPVEHAPGGSPNRSQASGRLSGAATVAAVQCLAAAGCAPR